MKNYKIIIILFCLIIINNYLFSQENKNDSIKVLYNRTIKIANELYKNKHYNESIAYYKAAKRLDENEKLPQFRLEDIKTIFIKYDIASDREEAQKIIDKVQEKIASEDEQNKIDDFLYDIDTTALAENRKKQIKIDSLLAKNTIKSKQQSKPISETKIKTENTTITHPVLYTKPVEKTNEPKKNIEVVEEKPNIVQVPVENKETKPKKVNQSKPVIDEEEVNRKLIKKYPDEKTIENIEKPNKKIKKVIINKNGKVTIYLKVVHNWGATYYFVDRSLLNENNRDITQREFFAQTGEN